MISAICLNTHSAPLISCLAPLLERSSYIFHAEAGVFSRFIYLYHLNLLQSLKGSCVPGEITKILLCS